MGIHRGCVRERLTPVAAVLLSALASAGAGAGEIYRCVVEGKTTYTQSPPEGGDCRPARLPMTDPSPEEVARALDRKDRERAAEEAAAAEARERERQALDLRAVQAKEREADAAERRARAAEEQLRQSQPPQVQQPYGQTYYPIVVPAVPSGQFIPDPHFRPDHPLPPAPEPQRPPTVHGTIQGPPGGHPSDNFIKAR